MRRVIATLAAAVAGVLPVAAVAADGEASPGPSAPSHTSGPPDPATPVTSPPRTDPVFDLSGSDLSAPVSIRADALEATESGGVRTLIFQHHVEVEQGDLELRTEHLEALYPAGEKQPSRLRARGGVQVSQGGREARCQRAEYDRAAAQIRCDGDAALRDGADEILGEAIVFDLAARRVVVEGGARVAVTPRDGSTGPLPGLDGEGPITIEADGLEARETAQGRFLAFRGSVSVHREDLTLKADRIEVFYPPGAQEPQRMIAEGDVVAVQGDREARCARAEYAESERRLECRGEARLRRGHDRVSGDVVVFDLAAERLVISGHTRLLLAARGTPEQVAP